MFLCPLIYFRQKLLEFFNATNHLSITQQRFIFCRTSRDNLLFQIYPKPDILSYLLSVNEL